jgi:hypothetical protein
MMHGQKTIKFVVLVTYLSGRGGGVEIRKVVGYVIVEIICLYELYFGVCVDAL